MIKEVWKIFLSVEFWSLLTNINEVNFSFFLHTDKVDCWKEDCFLFLSRMHLETHTCALEREREKEEEEKTTIKVRTIDFCCSDLHVFEIWDFFCLFFLAYSWLCILRLKIVGCFMTQCEARTEYRVLLDFGIIVLGKMNTGCVFRILLLWKIVANNQNLWFELKTTKNDVAFSCCECCCKQT